MGLHNECDFPPLPVGGGISPDEKGAPGGVATLDADGKVPEEQLAGGGMSAETYDPDGAVADAGGIPSYVADNAPVTSVNGKTGAVVLKTSDLTNDSGFITDVVTDAIEEKIPTQASAQNQLADKAFVNSSVQTATANFRGNWASWSAVPTDATQYPVDYAGVKIPSANDYLVVVDTSDYAGQTLGGTWRFKYSGTWETDGKAGWHPEYQVNESPLTAAQLAALNSGITDALVGKVQQLNSTYSGDFPILAKNSSNTTSPDSVRYSQQITLNPGTGNINAVSLNEIAISSLATQTYVATQIAAAIGDAIGGAY